MLRIALVLLLLPVMAWAEPLAIERDFRALFKPASLGGMALAFSAAGLAHGLDNELTGRVDNGLIKPLLDVGNSYLGTKHSAGLAAGSWLVARALHCDEVHAASGETLRALVLVGAMVAPLKVAVGRERPDGSNKFSFPSGHAANAFAISTVLGRRYGRAIGGPLFALASFVPVARIHDRHHFFSDVVAGAVLGMVAGLSVAMEERESVALIPVYADRAWLLNMSWSY